MLLLLTILSTLSYALSPQNCANDCRIELKDDGIHYVACSCTKKIKPWNNRSKEIFFHSRLSGATAEEAQIIQENLCAAVKAPGEISKLRPLATRPICECVSTRAHFRISPRCKRSAAGANICLPSHAEQLAEARPLTLFDYQSCVVDRVNYRKPESCQEATCDKAKPACEKGKELVNIADPEACCPVFVCRPK